MDSQPKTYAHPTYAQQHFRRYHEIRSDPIGFQQDLPKHRHPNPFCHDLEGQKPPGTKQTTPPSEEEGVIPEDFEMTNMLEDDAKINQCEDNNFNIRKLIKAGRGDVFLTSEMYSSME